MTKGSLLSLVGAGLGAVLLAACGSGSTTTPVTSKSPSSNNSTVVVAEAPLSGPNWFFPVIGLSASSNTNIQTDSLMYKPVLHITNQDTVNYKRSLAEKITYNKAGDE